MKLITTVLMKDASAEIATLIETLYRTDQRLEELTGGGVDSVANIAGQTFMLQRAQAQLHHYEAERQAAILNALPAGVVLLDSCGAIISVNATWGKFTYPNLLQNSAYGIGDNYLDICAGAQGDGASDAHKAALGMQSVLQGKARSFSLEYSCLVAGALDWFMMTITRLSEKRLDGGVVMHTNITRRKDAEQDLHDTQQRLANIVTCARDAIIAVDEYQRIFHSNPAAEQMFGYSSNELRGQLLELLLPACSDASNPAPRTVFDDCDINASTTAAVRLIRGVRKNGEDFPIEASFARDDSTGREFFTAILRDVSERIQAEARISYLNRAHTVLVRINALIVSAVDRNELFREACEIAVDIGGFRMALITIIDHESELIVPVASAGKDKVLLGAIEGLLASREQAGTTMIARAIREKQVVVATSAQTPDWFMFNKKYVETTVHSLAVFPLFAGREAVGTISLYANEVEFFHSEELIIFTELASDIAYAMDHLGKQSQLDYLAYYDVLTGLANRNLFLERVTQYMQSSAAAEPKLAIGLLDIERFRSINDSLARNGGDILLQQLAQWLTEKIGNAGQLARLDSDHFAFVLPEIKVDGNLAIFVEDLVSSLQVHDFQINEASFRIAAKLGIALFPDDGATADILLENAEAALKKAKIKGERYLFYTRHMAKVMAGKLTLENKLRRALEREEFVLHYQPKINLASRRLVGAEALLRWNDPTGGLVPPDKFIPVLEETGLINEVGRWVLGEAIGDYLRWRQAGLSAVRIAVNVSPLQLRSSRSFVDGIRHVIGVHPEAAAGLELEITESLVMEDIVQNIAMLKAIRALGVTIAIDDFGTGFSSLGYLAKLPADTLKIDRSFITDLPNGSDEMSLVASIINLAHSLRLKVVAEGVETAEQLELLGLLGCDELQGYYFSKPVSRIIFETQFLVPLVQEPGMSTPGNTADLSARLSP